MVEGVSGGHTQSFTGRPWFCPETGTSGTRLTKVEFRQSKGHPLFLTVIFINRSVFRNGSRCFWWPHSEFHWSTLVLPKNWPQRHSPYQSRVSAKYEPPIVFKRDFYQLQRVEKWFKVFLVAILRVSLVDPGFAQKLAPTALVSPKSSFGKVKGIHYFFYFTIIYRVKEEYIK